jgi:hypothetical protein
MHDVTVIVNHHSDSYMLQWSVFTARDGFPNKLFAVSASNLDALHPFFNTSPQDRAAKTSGSPKVFTMRNRGVVVIIKSSTSRSGGIYSVCIVFSPWVSGTIYDLLGLAVPYDRRRFGSRNSSVLALQSSETSSHAGLWPRV